MIRLWRFEFFVDSQWDKKQRKFTHNDIDWVYLDISTSNEDIQLNICLIGIGIGIMFIIKEDK